MLDGEQLLAALVHGFHNQNVHEQIHIIVLRLFVNSVLLGQGHWRGEDHEFPFRNFDTFSAEVVEVFADEINGFHVFVLFCVLLALNGQGRERAVAFKGNGAFDKTIERSRNVELRDDSRAGIINVRGRRAFWVKIKRHGRADGDQKLARVGFVPVEIAGCAPSFH